MILENLWNALFSSYKNMKQKRIDYQKDTFKKMLAAEEEARKKRLAKMLKEEQDMWD